VAQRSRATKRSSVSERRSLALTCRSPWSRRTTWSRRDRRQADHRAAELSATAALLRLVPPPKQGHDRCHLRPRPACRRACLFAAARCGGGVWHYVPRMAQKCDGTPRRLFARAQPAPAPTSSALLPAYLARVGVQAPMPLGPLSSQIGFRTRDLLRSLRMNRRLPVMSSSYATTHARRIDLARSDRCI